MNTKRLLLSLLLLNSVSLAIEAVSFSYALYAASVRVNQATGSEGIVKKSIFLCPNIWEVDDPLYVMHAYNSSSAAYADLVPSKTVSITVSATAMECKVFEFDTLQYDSFVFYRENPSNGSIWNQTDNIVSWDGSVNVYRIIDWDNGYGSHHSGYGTYNYSRS